MHNKSQTLKQAISRSAEVSLIIINKRQLQLSRYIDNQIRQDQISPFTMTSELIVDFPSRSRRKVAVRFDDTAQVCIIDRHEDKDHKNELWYTEAEYLSMKRDIRRDVLQARANGFVSEEGNGFWIGVAHLLTPACIAEVKACRIQCTQAVLTEQARLGPSASFRCEYIALASLAETRRASLRAKKLGRLHQYSI